MSKKNSQGRNWVGIIAAILAFFIVLNVISYIWFPFLPWFEQRDAGQETVEQTYDAENAIQQYEEFRQMYHDIEAQRNQVENAYDEDESFHETYGDDPNNWSRTAETRHGRIHERITGNQNQLEQLVADYNAQSDMANKELFKCHLPYKVDDRFAIQGPPGSGDAEQPVDTGPNGNSINGSPPEAKQCDGLPDKVES